MKLLLAAFQKTAFAVAVAASLSPAIAQDRPDTHRPPRNESVNLVDENTALINRLNNDDNIKGCFADLHANKNLIPLPDDLKTEDAGKGRVRIAHSHDISCAEYKTFMPQQTVAIRGADNENIILVINKYLSMKSRSVSKVFRFRLDDGQYFVHEDRFFDQKGPSAKDVAELSSTEILNFKRLYEISRKLSQLAPLAEPFIPTPPKPAQIPQP